MTCTRSHPCSDDCALAQQSLTDAQRAAADAWERVADLWQFGHSNAPPGQDLFDRSRAAELAEWEGIYEATRNEVRRCRKFQRRICNGVMS